MTDPTPSESDTARATTAASVARAGTDIRPDRGLVDARGARIAAGHHYGTEPTMADSSSTILLVDDEDS
ncbi:MAG TPA: hypothetical protein VFI37_05640, partial [Gaiellaceae bacterium]|nr:hypothetical protein [Gaiellaceae bacterium]